MQCLCGLDRCTIAEVEHGADCVGLTYMNNPPHAWKPKLIRHAVVKIMVAAPNTKVQALLPVLKEYCRAVPNKSWVNKVRLDALNWITGKKVRCLTEC